MSALELLSELRRLDVRLWLEGGRLRFRAPEGALTPELRARLAERRDEILSVLGQALGTGRPPLSRVDRAGELPLSFSQERLWFVDQWEPGGFAYNIPQAVRLAGRLDVRALARGLGEIVRRHEALRTTFPAVDGRPVQEIHPELPIGVPIGLPVVDLAALEDGERRERCRDLLLEEARRPFDLARLPLLRATLLRLGPEEHVLLLNLHHIVSDGWSTGVLLGELTALYEAFAAGRPSPLPELPIQYADFAVWQRRWLRDETLEEQLSWWRERLDGAPRVLELPADRPRPPVRSLRGASLFFSLPADLSLSLKALARQEGATLFIVLLAAFDLLLHRWTGQEDLVVGSPIANRNHAEIEGLIGFFVNTLALRTRLDGEPTFRELLARVREATLGAYAHQDLPFERLVEELRPERDTGHPALFQVLLALQNAAVPEIGLSDLSLTPLTLDSGAAKFDLSLMLLDTEPELQGWLEYGTDLFEAATAARWLGQMRNLLAGLSADAGQRISRVPLLGEAELHQLTFEQNDTAADLPDGPCLHELVAAQARRTPGAVALVHGGEEVSYADLEARASRLSRRLLRLGAGPEVPVGIFLERSPDLVAALLAVLKAGAAYLPLDPQYPRERVAFMLADAGAPVVLSRAPLSSALPEGSFTVLAVDEEEGGSAVPAVPVSPDNLAYLIYTSGSTGRPKGVAIRHRSAVALLAWAAEVFPDEDLAGVLASTSICFDLSVFEIFLPLSRGGTVILAENALELPELPAAARVTLVNTVPSAIGELLRLEALPAGLRTVNLAGEPLPKALADRIHTRTAARLLNLYGPSEDTTYSTFARVERGAPGAPTIGRPIAGTRALVLDRRLELAPVGVPGELCLGGAGLARGYLRRPDLTAERFIPDPSAARGGEPGGRLYRTGDLVRRLPSGEIEFLGRIDHQVKVRGFRIELGEIETSLAAHPGVHEAVAVVLGRQEGARLAVYMVPADPEAAPGAAELRAFLETRLPSYMVPSAFVTLPRFPRTPNGKVDRKALPDPDPAAAARLGLVAPRTPVEEMIAGIWSELLKVEPVGSNDNFFDLGGHSLLATQVVSRVRTTLGVDVPLRRLFEAPTVAGLARAIDQAHAEGRSPEAPPIVRVPRDGDLPLSFSQERLWLFERLAPGTAAYNTYRAARVRGDLDIDALRWTFEEIVRRHEVLRTTFEQNGGRSAQVIHPEAPLCAPLVDLQGLPEAAREQEALHLAGEDARLPFDLGRLPLLRLRLLRLGEREHVVVLTMHHIVYDIWSGWVLFTELETLYLDRCAGRPSPLPELPVQYADFAHWQRHWLDGEVLEAQLGYWQRQLAGLPAVLEMPYDRPRPAVQTYRGSAEPVAITGPLLGEVKALSRREGTTLFMTLLAVYYALLRRSSGQDDLAVGSPIANRTRTEVEGLIGFFVNTLVLRCGLAGDLPGRELLRRTREMALEAFAHQDLPFEKLVEELQPERRRGVQPLFQVAFSFIANYPALTRTLAGLELTPLTFYSGSTHFDLHLFLAERQGGLHGMLDYSIDLFDSSTLRRLAQHYRNLLAGLVARPEARLEELSLLGEGERVQLLAEWSDSEAAYPRDGLIHEVFAARAARAPEAVVAVCAGREITYRELDGRANRLARRLRSLGVGPDVLVGICLERSIEMVVGLLGILKAGGAYLPLDPAYPAERLALMLDEAEVPVLITQGELASALPSGKAEVLRIDLLEGESREAPPTGATAGNLAYVTYTSGSTGRPKGVAIHHRGVLRLVLGATYARLDADETVLQFAPVAFDASTLEIWGPLLNGGRIAILPPGTPSLQELGRALESHGVTTAFLTSGLFHQMVDEAPEALAGLRQLMTGGDVLSVQHMRRLLQTADGRGLTLIACYGPTENTTFTSCHPLRDPGSIGPTVSIGRPISNTRVLLLGRDGEPVAAGVAGELCIGGDGLARGYFRRPDLTAERFVPDALGGAPGERLYRTGDLARWRRDGNLEFVGRIDQQVKIRGFRIELGEVEAALAACPGVRVCAVTASADGASGAAPGDKRLVAYAVAEEGAELDAAGLRDLLAAKLPSWMVPSAFVVLPELPLNANGKIDRRALPAPEIAGAGGVAAPSTPEERRLAAIWEEVLGVERVGRTDNFFALGGHSLLATQVVSRVRQAFGLELPLAEVFEAATLADLAERLRANGGAAAPFEAPPMLPLPARPDPAPLSFAQRGLWFADQRDPGHPAYDVPLALHVRGRLDIPALFAAFREVVRRHEALRTTFGQIDGEPFQRVEPPPGRVGSTVDLEGLPEPLRAAEAARLRAAEAAHRFDLARGPLYRVVLLRLGPDEHALLLNLHHIVADGWSMGVLLRELLQLYGAGELPGLLPLQYADFAAWEQRWLRGEPLERLLGYWRERLAGELPLPRLPADRPRPAVPSGRGALHPLTLPGELARDLAALAQSERTTLFVVLLAGFQALLHGETGAEDLLIGSPVAHRNRAEIEGMIGVFLNTMVLRTDLSGDPPFRELVGRVRETTLGAHAHQDLPFEKLVETVAPGRDLRGSPLYCAWFVLQNNPMPELAAEGLELVPMDGDGLLTKFDLSLNLMETPAGIVGRFEFSTDLFDAGTVSRLAAGYAALLQAAGRNPGIRLSALAQAAAEAAAEAGRREKGLRQQEFQSALRSSLQGLLGARRRPAAQKGEAP